LLYVDYHITLQFFSEKNVAIIIVFLRINLRRILAVLECYEIIAMFKALSYSYITETVSVKHKQQHYSKRTVDLHEFNLTQ